MLVLQGHTAPIRAVAYSPDGKYLATGSEDETVRLWDCADYARAPEILRASSGVETVAFAVTGEWVVAGTAGGDIVSWGGPPFVDRRDFRASNTAMRRVLPLRAPNEFIAISWHEQYVHFHCAGEGVELLARDEAPQSLTGLARSADGNAVYFCGKSNVWEWDVTGIKARPVLEDLAYLYGIAVDPTGSYLALGTTAGDILLHPLGGGGITRLRGHTSTIYGLQFTPDGRCLVSGGGDRTTRIWDVASGRECHTYTWHQSWVTSLAIAPDGLTVATGSDDHTIVVWDMPED